MFSLDVFDEPAPWYMLIVGFLMHSIPSIVMALFLWAAWKHPSIGAVFFFLVMLGFAAIVRTFGHIMTLVTFMVPPFIVGLLFLFDYFQQVKYSEDLIKIPSGPERINMEPESHEIEDIEPIPPMDENPPVEEPKESDEPETKD